MKHKSGGQNYGTRPYYSAEAGGWPRDASGIEGTKEVQKKAVHGPNRVAKAHELSIAIL